MLAERGYRVEREIARRFATEAWDGREHREHSASEAHYSAWERERWRAVMAASDVAEADVVELLDALDERKAAFRMRPFPEVLDVLTALRDRGVRLAVCSNWDWDLDRHLVDAGIDGLLDARVSSAWVGARKPHPRIYEAVLGKLGAAPAEAVFVGDNWAADVEGPLAMGMRAVHVWRHDETPDWLPPVPDDGTVARVTDLRPLLDLVS